MERSPSPHRPHQVYWQNLGWAHKLAPGAIDCTDPTSLLDIVTGTAVHHIPKEQTAYMNGFLSMDEKLPRRECVFPYGVTTYPEPMLTHWSNLLQ
ncbi:hypothetical protein Y1Q_0017829 [Alligator mississippiensis]|uniref:Uncharacterized protein n=1 Tax=Alligator mississippiensis TaxID=8496 RepID=A0A151MJV2_ALLMI|nr:hypothetical protein Y1Q_0017829 [Alligator mississippiensis]